ncbi:hypothetical protein [Flagellimonas iocasae]|uniref:Lipoprotein n=1 Tax=Flagellimonas iocasae TaxID=2055905 RepID=A0ABW4XZS2_9FLAO
MRLFVNFRKSFVKGVIIISFMISCSESNNPESETLLDKSVQNIEEIVVIEPEEFGIYHNKILSVFLTEVGKNKSISSKKSISDFKSLLFLIKETVDEKDSTLINEQDYELTIQNLDEVLASFDNTDTPLDYYSLSQRLFELKTSKRLASLFSEFLYGNYSYDRVLEKTNLFKKRFSLSSKEMIHIIQFENTLKASKEIWDGIPKRFSSAKWDCKAQDQQYLADAFGALFGGFGAVGYSYAIYILQDGGSGCI